MEIDIYIDAGQTSGLAESHRFLEINCPRDVTDINKPCVFVYESLTHSIHFSPTDRF